MSVEVCWLHNFRTSPKVTPGFYINRPTIPMYFLTGPLVLINTSQSYLINKVIIIIIILI